MTAAVRELYDTWSSYQTTRLDAFPCELHVHRTLMVEHLRPASRILDVGAGPGRYAIELGRAGHRVSAGDLSPVQVELARAAVAEAKAGAAAGEGAGVESVEVLDALDLGRFSGASFDAVVALGPFYHLKAAEQRRRAVYEASRVLRPGGLIFASLMPRTFWLSMALHTFVTDPAAPDAQLAELERLLESGELGKVRSPQLKSSWFCRIEEVAPLFAEHGGFSQRALVASSGVTSVWSKPGTWSGLEGRDPAVRARLLDLVFQTASDPHVLGMSDQVLYIGEKQS